eukprot:jgi/Chlat1/4388/Chrsp29S04528
MQPVAALSSLTAVGPVVGGVLRAGGRRLVSSSARRSEQQVGLRWPQHNSSRQGGPAATGIAPRNPQGYRSLTLMRSSRFMQELQELRKEAADAAEAPESVQWTSPLKIAIYPDPVLRRENKLVRVFDDNLVQLTKEMFDVMYRTDGVGLAAPQVGVNMRLMCFNPAGERGKGQEVVLVNPTIVKRAKKTDVDEEGCLSFPEIFADVERSVSIKVEAQDVNGRKIALQLRDFTARIFQHEYDHLDGVLFFDRMSPKVMQDVQPKLDVLISDYERQHGTRGAL